jgi:hypothetical protein
MCGCADVQMGGVGEEILPFKIRRKIKKGTAYA